MKGDIHFMRSGKLQCRYCYENKRHGNHGCPFCSRMRWIDALKDDHRDDKPEERALLAFGKLPVSAAKIVQLIDKANYGDEG